MSLEKLGLKLLHQMDPETAHGMAIKALKMGLAPAPGPFTSPRLESVLAGLDLPNPVGLAAGFDKNAEAVDPLLKAGFGFIEVGAATPLPQPGNPKPRLFRLSEDRAAINRFGFNNEGMGVIANRLKARSGDGVVGINLGANKTSTDRAGDYVSVLSQIGPYVDFATVNVSSPNTEKLRDLQGKAALTALLQGVMDCRENLPDPIPVFLKIAPDLTEAEIADIAETAMEVGLSGIIATNTTLDRDGLQSAHRGEAGGLSGDPLFEKSTAVLARLYRITGTQVPLIGVGGINSAERAYAKIRAGAAATQLYTAMVYQGLGLANTIARGLDELLQRDGFSHISEAVGVDTQPNQI